MKIGCFRAWIVAAFLFLCAVPAQAANQGIDSVSGTSLPLSAGGSQVALLNAATLNLDLTQGVKIGSVAASVCGSASYADGGAGLLRYTASGMEYCNGATWKVAFSSGENNGGFTVGCLQQSGSVCIAGFDFALDGTPYCKTQGCSSATIPRIGGGVIVPTCVQIYCPNNCTVINPKTGGCSCPAGTTAMQSSYQFSQPDSSSSIVTAYATFVCQ
ncbi:MAG: hypothetical protein PHX43_06245 [Alphaproteobacteria bacterium]|nr:hypothetical protein [Alphaproteobacteria bacterium]